MKRAIVWFRQDLRIQDNNALNYANQECDEIIPVFIADDNPESINNIGRASQVWLHHSLARLRDSLEQYGCKLVIRKGDALDVLESLAIETDASELYWNRCYEPHIITRDENIKSTLKQTLTVKSYKGNLLFEPWETLKADGTPYRVFTPYWKSLQQKLPINRPIDYLDSLKHSTLALESLSVEALQLLPKSPTPRWDKNIISNWQVGENCAHDVINSFLDDGVKCYKENRDFPAIDGTSKLSPHLHFGEISPRQVFHYCQNHKAMKPENDVGVEHVLRQLAWREFAYSLIYHFPQTTTQPLFEKFKHFEWRDDQAGLKRWQQGQTGFPIIDAGMRELWNTAYMHNRVRMIVASFLCKNLLIHWHSGEAWFRDTLVDADLANNVMGWQWVAGSGADAAPYYRIFNPILQSKKFDPKGDYIRRWIPELRGLENKDIHQPSAEQARYCHYPTPMVDLKATRERALDRYAKIK